MVAILAELTARMADFNTGYPELTQHFIKVHGFARTIGLLEGLDDEMQTTLEMAALTHDIGIKPCMEQHGTCTGKMQEAEGPPHARVMLADMGVDAARIDRVCFLIGHHHTYKDIDGIDYRILLEADFLVNLFESSHDEAAQAAAYQNIFETEAGKRLFKSMYTWQTT